MTLNERVAVRPPESVTVTVNGCEPTWLAFGTQSITRYSGIIEKDGLPTRPQLKSAEKITPDDSSATPSPDEKSRHNRFGARLDNEGNFALASASLRQAMQDMPEIADISKNIMFEETKQGLNIEIMDQNGSSMFPEGSKEPFERTRRLVQRLAAGLKTLLEIVKTAL